MSKIETARAMVRRVKEEHKDDPLEVISPNDYMISAIQQMHSTEQLAVYCIRLKAAIRELTTVARAVECRTEATLIVALQTELLKSQERLRKIMIEEVTPK